MRLGREVLHAALPLCPGRRKKAKPAPACCAYVEAEPPCSEHEDLAHVQLLECSCVRCREDRIGKGPPSRIVSEGTVVKLCSGRIPVDEDVEKRRHAKPPIPTRSAASGAPFARTAGFG